MQRLGPNVHVQERFVQDSETDLGARRHQTGCVPSTSRLRACRRASGSASAASESIPDTDIVKPRQPPCRTTHSASVGRQCLHKAPVKAHTQACSISGSWYRKYCMPVPDITQHARRKVAHVFVGRAKVCELCLPPRVRLLFVTPTPGSVFKKGRSVHASGKECEGFRTGGSGFRKGGFSG
eukprot:3008161-Rhodomonas_salina.1